MIWGFPSPTVNQTLLLASRCALSEAGSIAWMNSVTLPSWPDRPGTRMIFRRISQLETPPCGTVCDPAGTLNARANATMPNAAFLI